MKITGLIITLFIWGLNSFAQVKELENFRNELTFFINYDNGKIDSIKKSEENTAKFKNNMEKSFLQFVLNKESKNLDNLKTLGKNDGKNNYWFVNRTYSFINLRREMLVKSLENNVDYYIGFSGLYDYQLSNFVSFYIQPLTINKVEYAVYYYKLNAVGKYFIKQIKNNKIVFSSEAFTSYAPILSLNEIDKNHILIIEDMGNDGQRAIVLKIENKIWEPTDAFKGKLINPKDPKSIKSFSERRTYLRLVSTKTINSHLSYEYLKGNGIKFNTESKTISYTTNQDNSTSNKAKWENNMFVIDDYYLGEHLIDESPPFPG
ncbi:MAG: hypothetical protein ABIP68_04975 [Ferruginibacter sp.]